MKKIIGIGASPGIAIGIITHLNNENCDISSVRQGTLEEEQERFIQAQNQALEQLNDLEERTKKSFGEEEAKVFASHVLMLKDPMLESAVNEKIAANLSAEAAVEEATKELSAMLQALEDEYLRERAADVKDVGKRLIRVLQGKSMNKEVSGIVVAEDLLPSDTATLNLKIVQGFVTAAGGKTSHSSIIARAAGIPAVVGIGEAIKCLSEQSQVIIDGHTGIVLVDPDEKLLKEYQARLDKEQQVQARLAELKMLPAVTRDGENIEVAANIGTPQDMVTVVHAGADGVGLFRTEFLFLQRDSLPTEEEQVDSYQAVLSAMPDKKIVIRTLDAGGDKELPFLAGKPETNPALGLRAIRLCLARKDVFKTQLRALLRASVVGNLHIMFPMIATLEELMTAKAMLEEAKKELAAENILFQADVPVGIMVEVPAAAVNADLFAPEVDFFSIGTNDLVQYTLAADRMNDQVSYLSDYFQPAVLRLIQLVVKAAGENGKWVGMCGEMAGDPLATPLLVGMGISELSMSARSVASVKNKIRNLSVLEAREWAAYIVKLKQVSEVRQYLAQIANKLDQAATDQSSVLKNAVRKIAIMTSGGDCPGMNAAIRAAVRVALSLNMEVWGIKNGYAGMTANEFIPLDSRSVGDIIQKGGTFLGTARSEEFKTSAGRQRAFENLKRRGIEGVLVLGGDGSLTGAAMLGELGMNVVGLPATIDNDIYGTDYTIGFDTAVNTAVDAINKLRDTASSHGRVMVIEVMGRHCGAIALTAGLAGGAESILIPEEPFDLDSVCKQLLASKNAGKQYSIVVVAEGVGSALKIGDTIASKTGLETRVSVLGHIQRGGAPTVFDRMLASTLAERAVFGLAAGVTQVMYGVHAGRIVPTNIHDAVTKKKNFNEDLCQLSGMISK
ncbi:6-phosphofructokinase [Sporomusaceae bacterium BoRhaA]|nr:6-phosphofructokinase [Pelorhabdus rhamnosifermentans]